MLIEKGEKMARKAVEGVSPEDYAQFISKLMAHFHITTRDGMYLAIGCGHIEINEGIVKSLCKKQNLRLLNRLWPFGKNLPTTLLNTLPTIPIRKKSTRKRYTCCDL